MSENKNQTAGNENNPQPAIMINTQYIKDLSLEIPHAPEIFRELTEAPNVGIHVDVDAVHLHDNYYNVNLSVKADGDIKTKKLFILELVYSAVVSLNVPQEHIEPVLLVEIPRLIFPFARSIVTNCLAEGGLPPLMISPMDFGAMYQQCRQGD